LAPIVAKRADGTNGANNADYANSVRQQRAPTARTLQQPFIARPRADVC